MLLNRASGKLIEELKAEQVDARDLVHLALPSGEEASFGRMKPRLRGLAKTRSDVAAYVVCQRKSCLGPLDAQLDARGCRRALIHDAAKRCAQSLEAYPLGDVYDVAASHFLSLCQSFRALLALASDDLVRTGLMTWWPCRICR